MNTESRESKGASWPGRVDGFAFWALLGVVIWAPLPLGSNRAWAVSLLAIVLSALLLLVIGSAMGSGRAVFGGARARAAGSPYLPISLLACYALLVLAQIVPLPSGVASVDPYATRQYLLACLAYLSAFCLVLALARSEQRLRWLVGALLASGVLQAVIGIASFSIGADIQYLFATLSPGDRVSGTFPNPDHFAGYMEMSLSAGIGLMLASMGFGERRAKGWRENTVALLQFTMSPKMLVRLLLVVQVIALVLTRSRMGNAAFFGSLLVIGALCALRSQQLRRGAMWLIVSLLVVDVIVVGQWVGLDKVVQRLQDTAARREAVTTRGADGALLVQRSREESIEERLQAARYALEMPMQRPWLGFGGGTFYTAFPQFKGSHPLGFYDHAHNDYVEIAADTGLTGLALLLALVGLTAWRALRALSDDSPPLTRGLAAGALLAICCIAIHSTVDFNLQIPANALSFTVLLAVVWSLPGRARRRSSRSSSEGEHV